MNAKLQDPKKFDGLWWTLIVLLLALAIGANAYFSAQPLALRLIGWLVLTCVLLAMAWQTRYGQKVWEFAKEARIELRKVTWPTRQETMQSTLGVLLMVIVMSLLLWGVDSLLLWLIGFLTGQRG